MIKIPSYGHVEIPICELGGLIFFTLLKNGDWKMLIHCKYMKKFSLLSLIFLSIFGEFLKEILVVLAMFTLISRFIPVVKTKPPVLTIRRYLRLHTYCLRKQWRIPSFTVPYSILWNSVPVGKHFQIWVIHIRIWVQTLNHTIRFFRVHQNECMEPILDHYFLEFRIRCPWEWYFNSFPNVLNCFVFLNSKNDF